MNLILHPYALVFYGILLWEIEQSFAHGLDFKQRINNIGRSLIWGGAIVVFDDEIVELVEDKFDVLLDVTWYHYSGAGFFIDIIRSKIAHEPDKQRERGVDI